MGEQIVQVYDLIRSVVTDPTSNLTLAVLLMAMLIIVVLLLSATIYLLLVLRSGSSRGQSGARPDESPEESPGESPEESLEEAADASSTGESAAEEQPPTSGAGRTDSRRGFDRRYLLVGLVVFVILLIVTYGLTGGDRFCADSCHAGSEASLSAEQDAHVSVGCASCHEPGGLGAVPANVAWRTQYLIAQFGGGSVPERPVTADRCLACHDSVFDGVIENAERGLRMDHSAPLDAGMTCQDCHTDSGHGTLLSAGMNPCLRCHDGEQADAECSTCHLDDPAQAAVSERPFPKVRVANRDCGACHDLAPCDECHGTRMPHSETFVAYAHAKDAAFEAKESCYLCHEESDCGACHATWQSGHGPTAAARRLDHVRKLSRTPVTGEHGCTCHGHNPYRNYCAICHEEAGSVF